MDPIFTGWQKPAKTPTKNCEKIAADLGDGTAVKNFGKNTPEVLHLVQVETPRFAKAIKMTRSSPCLTESCRRFSIYQRGSSMVKPISLFFYAYIPWTPFRPWTRGSKQTCLRRCVGALRICRYASSYLCKTHRRGLQEVKNMFRCVPLIRLFLRNNLIADDMPCIKVELI